MRCDAPSALGYLLGYWSRKSRLPVAMRRPRHPFAFDSAGGENKKVCKIVQRERNDAGWGQTEQTSTGFLTTIELVISNHLTSAGLISLKQEVGGGCGWRRVVSG